MQEVYNWVDEIPLSRPKKNISRDFADCGKFILYEILLMYDSNWYSFGCRSCETFHSRYCRAS